MEPDVEEKYMKRAAIPKRYWGFGATIHKLEEDSGHYDTVFNYLTNIGTHIRDGTGLLLWGAHSTGKTALACLALKKALQLRKTCLFTRFDCIAEYTIEGTKFDEYQTFAHRMSEVDLLVIDELIDDKSRVYSLGRVEQVLRQRTFDLKPTILTTNIPLSQLKSAAQGLVEACREATYPVKVAGRDFRSDRVVEMQARLEVCK